MKKVFLKDLIFFINRIDDIDITEEQIDDDLSSIGMNSINYIKLIVMLEEEYECEIPDSKLLLSEMNSLRKIMDVLENLYVEGNGV